MNTSFYGSDSEMRERIASLLARRRDYRQEVKNMTRQYEYVVFYGCGIILNRIIDTWNSYVGRKIDFCCDRDPDKWGKFFRGVECKSPQALLKLRDKCVVFVTVGDFKPVFDLLRQSGFPAVHQIFKYDLAASDFLTRQNHAGIADSLFATVQLLADRKSVEVFEAIINRVLGDGKDIEIMARVYEKNEYFPRDIIRLSEHESFVDAGAFDGDTVRDFVSRTNGKFDHIFAFEVDGQNYGLLNQSVELLPNAARISTFNLGVLDVAGDISYSIGDSDSCIGDGEGKGRVVPLDDALKAEDVSFIKMDIEGAELRALQGARDIIMKQKPKLAICVYHDFRDLWEIPLFIKHLVPEYKIYLRHHTTLEYETVCYAVL